MQNIVVIGATSAIAKAVARLYAAQGARLYLVARDEMKLSILAKDLTARGCPTVETRILDLDQTDAHQGLIGEIFAEMGRVDGVLIAHGTLPDQSVCQTDVTAALACMQTNAISTISLLTHLANRFEEQKFGTIAVITSVAGDRGRQSNYVYGSSKAMVSAFMQGLRGRLCKSNVTVLDIKPGFVDTPMTAALPKGALWATPEQVGKSIVKAIEGKKDILYTPFFWRPIMMIVRGLPEAIFKHLKF